MGKSTTGNKLLGFYDSEIDKKKYSLETFGMFPLSGNMMGDRLKLLESTAGSLSSTTKDSLVVTNKTLGVTVLDVQGFADSDTCHKEGVYRGNLEIIRSMLHAQASCKTGFNRVVYFLPNRRIPEKADGNLQEELKVMYHFFGDELFTHMVIVVTSSPLDGEDMKVTPAKIQHLQKVFLMALRLATNSTISECPPIVYISIQDDGSEVRKKLSEAEVMRKTEISLKVLDDTCINCGAKIENVEIKNDKVKQKSAMVIDPTNGEKIEYEQSKCHPMFIPKYSKIKKFVGGISIILTLGTTKAAFHVPGFFNSEEICVKCKYSPESPGCCNVKTLYQNDSVRIFVDHKTSVETRTYEL